MTTATLTRSRQTPWLSLELLRRLAPTLVAATFAAAYVIISPPSLDLAAHLFRAQLFRVEGFGIWNNWWYSGHDIVGYSVLFPAVSAWLTPQLAGAIAATGCAALFEPLARRHFGPDAWLGAVLFGAATASNLYTGRLAFAFGALPALGAVVALDYRRNKLACGLALLSALCSPVAALFAALAACGYALGGYLERRNLRAALPGMAVAFSALAPIGLIAIAFPEGGSEPFGFPTMFPVLVVAAIALALTPPEHGDAASRDRGLSRRHDRGLPRPVADRQQHRPARHIPGAAGGGAAVVAAPALGAADRAAAADVPRVGRSGSRSHERVQ